MKFYIVLKFKVIIEIQKYFEIIHFNKETFCKNFWNNIIKFQKKKLNSLRKNGNDKIFKILTEHDRIFNDVNKL